MKWSIYNELIEDHNDESLFLFNSLRGKYFALDLRLKQLITEGSENVALIADQHFDLYSALKNEEFIVPDNLDETEECLQMLKRKFSSSPQLRITVNPTLDCNLKCWYCYESHLKGSSMSQETIEVVARFVEKQTSDSNLEKVHLSFFGGEPLIKYRRIVKPLIEKCAEICVNNGKPFVVSITTNGVCLTPSVVDDILSMGVTFGLQVAFDGNKIRRIGQIAGFFLQVCVNRSNCRMKLWP